MNKIYNSYAVLIKIYDQRITNNTHIQTIICQETIQGFFLFICTMILYESIICSSIRNEGCHVRIKIKSTSPFLCRCVLDLIASHLKTKVSIKYKKKENPNSQPIRRILKFKTFTLFFQKL